MASVRYAGGARELAAAQELLLAGGGLPAALPRQLRDSWLRCQSAGVDPESDAPVDLTDFEAQRAAHPLAAAMPVVRSLLVEHARDEGLVVAVTDASGRLLWVEGASASLKKADRIHFTEGARWGEGLAGTNAPALALSLDAPVQVRSHEHWVRRVQRWSCSAAPLHDPSSGELLGALDVTGDGRAVSSGALALVKATVAAVERELLLARFRSLVPAAAEVSSLSVLGATAGTLSAGAATRHLSLRHSELLLLLATHHDGLSAEALAVELDERELDPVTVRAEMSRLRRVLGDDALLTRPYRLALPVAIDSDQVRSLLDAGRVSAALEAYPGPVLPRSDAPGVVRIRETLAAELRAAVLGSVDASLVLRWAESSWGEDDLAAWSTARELLPDGVARRRATARLGLLNRRLGRAL